MKLELYYEVKPYIKTQDWGVRRPEIYKQFGFENHNGIDVRLGADKMVRAPFPLIIYKTGWQPQGGGLYLKTVSQDEYEFPDGVRCHVMADYLHLENFKTYAGQKHNIGDVLAVADNTGFSTGPHTHIAYTRVRKTPSGFFDVDSNPAKNTFDPTPFYTGEYAYDYGLKGVYKLINRIIALLQTNFIIGRQK